MIIDSSTPYCACGCGGRVAQNKLTLEWNKFINGHNLIVIVRGRNANRKKYIISKDVLFRSRRYRRNTINYHLKIIGGDKYLEYFDGVITDKKRTKGKGYNKLSDTHDDWEIFWAAKKAFLETVKQNHPDNNDGRCEKDIGEITESWNWIKERYDKNGKKRWRKRDHS